MTAKKIVLRKADIQRRVKELGQLISRDYAGRELLVVGVLNGAFVFMADLIREIDLDLQIDFVRVASYGQGSCPGDLRFTKDMEKEVEDRHLLIVEDIVDTGRTLACLREIFGQRRAASVRICALIDKPERREVPITLDYTGFEIKEGFLVGYGLDYAEHHRQYPEVYQLGGDNFAKII